MIKAIQTVYKGYKFRSRLEARYAVLFDELGIEWDYEAEGYELPDGTWYLPDFYLPKVNAYIEIKGEKSSSEEIDKSAFMADEFHISAILSAGDSFGVKTVFDTIRKEFPKSTKEILSDDAKNLFESMKEITGLSLSRKKSYIFEGGLDGNSLLCMRLSGDVKCIESPLASGLSYIFTASKDSILMYLCALASSGDAPAKIVDTVTNRIYIAITKARQARFEHGETPL
jgi:hypothetical protein